MFLNFLNLIDTLNFHHTFLTILNLTYVIKVKSCGSFRNADRQACATRGVLLSRLLVPIFPFVDVLSWQQVPSQIRGSVGMLHTTYLLTCCSPSKSLNWNTFNLFTGADCWIIAVVKYYSTKLPSYFKTLFVLTANVSNDMENATLTIAYAISEREIYWVAKCIFYLSRWRIGIFHI